MHEEVVKTACSSHCGGTCMLKVHVRDGVVTAIETDDNPDPQFRACPKGRAMRQMLYHPDRLTHPLRRVGERGEGRFERISWDEALDTVAGELKRVKATYGPGAIMCLYSGGDTPKFQQAGVLLRLLGLFGGYTSTWGTHSYEGGVWASLASYGSVYTSSGRDNLLSSRLIIMWGWNPVSAVSYSGTGWQLVKAREAGAEIVAVDPRLSNTVAVVAGQWIPIRPSTDAAMLIAMAHVIIKEGLQDQAFLDRFALGFEEFKRYVMGEEDGLPKTPAWAENITGVPAATIEVLARKYATVKPAALIDGIAPGRTAFGEQYHRAAIALATLTGNIGITGGNAPGRAWCGQWGTYPYKFGPGLPGAPNPYARGKPARRIALPAYEKFFRGANNCTLLTRVASADAMLQGKAGGYPEDYKLLYLMNYNYLNQILNINKTVRALKKMEFIVTHEHFMTATAKFADIVLPTSTRLERDDLCIANTAVPAHAYLKKVIEPVGETKSHFEICVELAARLGITNYSDKTDEEYVEQMGAGCDVPDAQAFKEEAMYKIPREGPYIAFEAQVAGPGGSPFPTPSGKIEIFSKQLADMSSPEMPPVPKYLEPWEGPTDPLKARYPLQLISTHTKRRAHTQYETVPWLKELYPQAVTINTLDARARGIKSGDTVRVFNDRGETRLPALVTERIMPGVVEIPEGAWYDADDKGVDRGGNPNLLTKDATSPGGAFPSNSCLVEVARMV
ncbi:MAG: molybdopterin-dependent oxidoreductase [Chloroflexi bacterium]|nr:molybdopterin-dependent oxidoreductase [Chloroflexota bacterium]